MVMDKKLIQKICNTTSLILLVVFVIKTITDYFQYDPLINSAPFYVWIIVNALWFVLPAITALIIGLILAKKQ